MRFTMSLRQIVYINPKPPKGALKHSVRNVNNNLR